MNRKFNMIFTVLASILTIAIFVLVFATAGLAALNNMDSADQETAEEVASWRELLEAADTEESVDSLGDFEDSKKIVSKVSAVIPETETETETETESESETEPETETEAQTEKETEKKPAETSAPTDNKSNTYIIANSNSQYISEADLAGLSEYQLMMARNEIYARRGRGFTDASIQEYFDNQSWYSQKYTAAEFDSLANSLFNNYEYQNIQTIVDYEKKMGYR